jgi:hypothetical protein
MTKLEYQSQIGQIEARLSELESQRVILLKQQSELDVGRLVEGKRIRKQLEDFEGSIADLNRMKQVNQQQLAKWKKNALPAETLRQQVGEMFEEGRALVAQIMKAQEDVAGWLQGIDVVNQKIGNLAGEHLKLIGEDMHAPPTIQVPVAMGFAWSNVPPIKNYDVWTYISDHETAAQAKTEREERRRAYEKLLKTANENGPDCPRCAHRDEAVKMQVDIHAGGKETPGQAFYDGQWYLVCPRCDMRTNATIAQTKRKG